MNDDIYFAPLLPWQRSLWTQLTTRASSSSLPHALLAAGMQGMGKRAFIWRLTAWLLCLQREQHREGACGQCASCQWLKSGTHPSLQVLPLAQMPISANSSQATELTSKSSKKSVKATTKAAVTIKVDDIRALQPFIYQGGQGIRICVLDYAEQMTIAAANALLKTLEEPQAQVHLLLISDAPAQLLPTIKSRVQQLPLQQIESISALNYVSQTLGSTVHREVVGPDQIKQLLQLANGAPLAAIDLAQAPWYSKRALWLTTWQALRSGKRSAIAASDYWQTQLAIADFIKLSEMMLVDIRRVYLGLPSSQQDIHVLAAITAYLPGDSLSNENLLSDNLINDNLINDNALTVVEQALQQIKMSLQQNVQEKFAYDKLMQQLVQL